jgi:uncharacterized protein (TIGR02246 family)
MEERSRIAEVTEAVARINRAWREGRPRDLTTLFHPEIVMVFPSKRGQARGRDVLVAGFVDFCENAQIHEYHESDLHVDVVGDTAVASYDFTMVYERAGKRNRSTGRDFWVFARHDGQWLAVWRTMLDMLDESA